MVGFTHKDPNKPQKPLITPNSKAFPIANKGHNKVEAKV